MKALLAWMVVGLAFTNFAQAENLPPGFDESRFLNLLHFAAEKGKPMKVDAYEYRVLSNISEPDPSKTHYSDYFSLVGGTDSAGNFGVLEISAVSEFWERQANGNWIIDQWIWEVAPNGELIRNLHYIIVETFDGSVLELKYLPNDGPQAPEELARWGAKLDQWYQRM